MKLAPVTLENAHVRLRAFAAETDRAELYALVERAPEIFRLWYARGPGDWVGDWVQSIRERTESGTMIAFAVTRPSDGTFLGVTSYLDPSEAHKAAEIGMTCYAPEAQGTVVNPSCKRLLMGHLFEAWGARRVQYQVDNRNERSKAAVLKLGARLEGVLRSNRTLPDGFIRDSAMFSILPSEWPEVKAKLDARIAAG